MTNPSETVFYTGVTNNLHRRVFEHRQKHDHTSFTSRYNVTKLVYYEVAEDIMSAIEREKQIKGTSRKKKLELICGMNPTWKDLADEI